jgi:hypothetical protein
MKCLQVLAIRFVYGAAITPDGKYLYISDTAAGVVMSSTSALYEA